MDKIERLRKEIDEIDDNILILLNKRASLGLQIAKEKHVLDEKNFHVPNREVEIYERLKRNNRGPFSTESIKAIFREIISATLSMERPLTISFLGPIGSFTYIAGITHFGSSISLISKGNIKEVFESVEKDFAEYGIVPIENSIEGSVNQSLDLLVNSNLIICGETNLEIQHYLMSRSKDIEEIEKIYSHPHAIAQCRIWLNKYANNIPIVEAASTSSAAKLALEEPNTAAIASKVCADIYQLNILAARIEDATDNYTRFLILGKKPVNKVNKTGLNKTSIIFAITDKPGELFNVLKPFSANKINLTKIESRPAKTKKWEYIFFVDMDGHIEEGHIKASLDSLRQRTIFLKILGSYPTNTTT